MSVASRIAAGALSRVGWYLEHNLSKELYVDNFGPLGVGENYLTINALWQRGLEAAYAGRLSTDANDDGNVPLGRIPGRGPARRNFRYTVEYTFQLSGSTDTITRIHHETSAYQLSQDMLEEIGRDLPTPNPIAPIGKPNYKVLTDQYELVDTRVISLEGWE